MPPPADGPALENGHHQSNGSEKQDEHQQRFRQPWREWVADHMSWDWFTISQSTGGIAAVISSSPKTFHGLQAIGIVVFIFNLALYLLFIGMMLTRWITKPATLRQSFTQAPECYFFGSFLLTFATIIIDMSRFGVPRAGPWLVVAIRACFWIYAALTILNTTLNMSLQFRHTRARMTEFPPPMFIMIYNVMLTGTVAGVIAMDQPPEQRLPIIVAGVAYQGLGWIVCIMFITLLFGNLMTNGWPARAMRPGLFITVGSSGFTIVALIGMARAAPNGYAYFAVHPTAAEVLLIVALWVGIFLWMISFWLFGLAFFINVVGLFVREEGEQKRSLIPYTNNYWAVIFPNVGFTLATIYIGEELQSQGIQWVSVAMLLALIAFWLFDLFLLVKTAAISLFVDARVKLS